MAILLVRDGETVGTALRILQRADLPRRSAATARFGKRTRAEPLQHVVTAVVVPVDGLASRW